MSQKKNAENTTNVHENTATETEASANAEVVAVIVDSAKLEKTLRSNVYASMGVGLVPVPLFNVAAVAAVQLNLVRQLSDMYGIEFKEGIAKKILTAVIGAGTGVLASPLVETAVIGIPLVGLPLAVGTKPMLNGLSTYAIGQMFITHFKRGGNFLNANVESMKEDFKASFNNSREWLGDKISGKKLEYAESAAE